MHLLIWKHDSMKRIYSLFALESREPKTNFDVIAFTLQYEFSYTNILNMIEKQNVPILETERKLDDPFILVEVHENNMEPMAESLI